MTPMNDALREPLTSPGPRRNIIRDVCIYILVMELAERLCFYTFSGSMIVYLRDYLHFSQAVASAMNSVFNTLVYLTPMVGGYVADAHLGRYTTIALFGSFYLAGTALMAAASFPGHEDKPLFMLSFFGLVALGAGGIKSNVVTMGGDQFNLDCPEESEQKDTYFVYFYWVINIGALVSYFVMAQIATNPTEFGLPRGYGFFTTFFLAACSLAMALFAFFSATNRYVFKKPSGSATARYCSAVWTAAFGGGQHDSPAVDAGSAAAAASGSGEGGGDRRGATNDGGERGTSARTDGGASERLDPSQNPVGGYKSARGSSSSSSSSPRHQRDGNAQCLVAGTMFMLAGVGVGVAQPFVSSDGPLQGYLAYAASGVAVCALVLVCAPTVGMPLWMFKATNNKAAMLATRVIPVLFNSVSFQVVYAAMNYFSLSACQMNVMVSVPFSSGSFQINASVLNAADCLAIIFMVPILDGYAYPMVDRWLGRKCRATEKYMAGLLVGIAAIVFAAWFEVLRREQPSVPACGAGTASATSGHLDDGKNDDDAPTPAPSTSISDDDAFLTAHSDCYSLCAYPGVQMSDFPVWWMAVPFFLVGLGECLCNIPLYELCYSQTPPAYRSMAQAVFLFVTAVGSMLTGAFTTALAPYVTDNLNDGHLEYFYYACIAFCIILVPVNVWCFAHFEEVNEREIEAMVYSGDRSSAAGPGGGGQRSITSHESFFSESSAGSNRGKNDSNFSGNRRSGEKDAHGSSSNVVADREEEEEGETSPAIRAGSGSGQGVHQRQSDQGGTEGLRLRPSGSSLIGHSKGSLGRYSIGGVSGGSIVLS